MKQTLAITTDNLAFGPDPRTTTYSIPELARMAKAEVRYNHGRALIAYTISVGKGDPCLVVEYRQRDGSEAVVRIAL